MRDVVADEIDGFEFDDESYNFLTTIGYLDGLRSALYRLIAEDMPQHGHYDIVANEMARFGRRWSSRHLLPSSAQRNVKRYQRLRPTLPHVPHRLDTSIPKCLEPKDNLQERFRKLADKRHETEMRPGSKGKATHVHGKLKSTDRTRKVLQFHSNDIRTRDALRFHSGDGLHDIQLLTKIPVAASIVAQESEHIENTAATKIQSVYRGRMERKRCEVERMYQDAMLDEDVKMEKPSSDSVLTRAVVDHENQLIDRDAAAIKIQSVYRGRMVRKRCDDEKKYQDAIRDEAVKMDSAFSDGVLMRSVEENDRDAAAIVIQKNWRGAMLKRRLKRNSAVDKNRHEAATKIQKLVRGRQSRQRTTRERNVRNKQLSSSAEDEAAATIQKAWRRHTMERIDENKEMQLLIIDKRSSGSLEQASLGGRHHAAATTIQKHVRGYQTRKKMQLEQRESAAISIQKHVRGHQMRKKMESEEMEAAAIAIQKHVRGFQTRKLMKSEQRETAAIVIQKHVRGYQTRSKLKTG